MDSIDFSVVGSLLLQNQARFWGGGLVIDPRVSHRRVAQRVGLSRVTVRTRLADWRRRGVFGGYETWPNPVLFGATLVATDLPAATPVEANDILGALAKTEGAISGRVLVGDRGRVVRAFHAVDRRSEDFGRLVRSVVHATGREPARPPRPFWVPPPEREPSGREWAIMAFYRAFPEAMLVQASERLGLSARTVARSRDRLIDDRALWWIARMHPVWTSVVTLRVRVAAPELRAEIHARLAREISGWTPCAEDGTGEPPVFSSDVVAGIARVETPGAIEELVHRVLTIDGVRSVRWAIPHQFRSYPAWIDERLERKLSERGRTSTRFASLPSALRSSLAHRLGGERPAGEAS